MKKIFTTAVFILIATTQAFATEVQKVYLDEAIKITIENNIDLVANELELKVAKNKILQANRLQNPSIDYYHFMGKSAKSEPKQLGLTQNIEIAKRNARKKLAKSELKLSEKNLKYTSYYLLGTRIITSRICWKKYR